MFSSSDMNYLRQVASHFVICRLNGHDATIQSIVTGHEWIIISFYDNSSCIIFHRHSRRYPYHRQKGCFRSLREAFCYISKHETWFINHKMKN